MRDIGQLTCCQKLIRITHHVEDVCSRELVATEWFLEVVHTYKRRACSQAGCLAVRLWAGALILFHVKHPLVSRGTRASRLRAIIKIRLSLDRQFGSLLLIGK